MSGKFPKPTSTSYPPSYPPHSSLPLPFPVLVPPCKNPASSSVHVAVSGLATSITPSSSAHPPSTLNPTHKVNAMTASSSVHKQGSCLQTVAAVHSTAPSSSIRPFSYHHISFSHQNYLLRSYSYNDSHDHDNHEDHDIPVTPLATADTRPNIFSLHHHHKNTFHYLNHVNVSDTHDLRAQEKQNPDTTTDSDHSNPHLSTKSSIHPTHPLTNFPSFQHIYSSSFSPYPLPHHNTPYLSYVPSSIHQPHPTYHTHSSYHHDDLYNQRQAYPEVPEANDIHHPWSWLTSPSPLPSSLHSVPITQYNPLSHGYSQLLQHHPHPYHCAHIPLQHHALYQESILLPPINAAAAHHQMLSHRDSLKAIPHTISPQQLIYAHQKYPIDLDRKPHGQRDDKKYGQSDSENNFQSDKENDEQRAPTDKQTSPHQAHSTNHRPQSIFSPYQPYVEKPVSISNMQSETPHEKTSLSFKIDFGKRPYCPPKESVLENRLPGSTLFSPQPYPRPKDKLQLGIKNSSNSSNKWPWNKMSDCGTVSLKPTCTVPDEYVVKRDIDSLEQATIETTASATNAIRMVSVQRTTTNTDASTTNVIPMVNTEQRAADTVASVHLVNVAHLEAWGNNQQTPSRPDLLDNRHNSHSDPRSLGDSEETGSSSVEQKSRSQSDSGTRSKNSPSNRSNYGMFSCKLCFKHFFSQQDLDHHEERHGTRRFSCPQCGTMFTQRPHLKTHINVVHGLSRTFSCPKCPKVFGTQSNLRRHNIIVHEKHRKFKCPHCVTTFVQKSDFRIHLTRVHHLDVSQVKSIISSAKNQQLQEAETL